MATVDAIIAQFFAVGRKIKHGLDAGGPHVSVSQLETLRFIQEQGRASMKDVAAFLLITPPSATTVVNTMAKAGLVSRRQDGANRRRVYISLTRKGEALLKAVIARRCGAFGKLLQHLSKHEQLTLFRLLSKLAETENL